MEEGIMKGKNKKRPGRVKLVPGNVNRDDEHIELLYGDPNETKLTDFMPVALVTPGPGCGFTVEFTFLPDRLDEESLGILEAVKDELDFYLVEKAEPDPWAYAVYHCSTTANLYSTVHWTHHHKGSSAGAASPRKAKPPSKTPSKQTGSRRKTKS
jgi:hypothetical protein